MSHGPYQKKYLVSPADMERLVEQYKGTLMENSRLTHAARLAAKQHVLLASPDLPPATKKIRVKALGPEVRRATKRVRSMNLPGAGGAAGADEDDEFAQGPMEPFLKTLIKSSTPQPKATPKGKPKLPPKPKFSSKTPISLPLPDDDWEEELAGLIPSTSKSKDTSTLRKGKSPTSTQRKTRFSFHLPKALKGQSPGQVESRREDDSRHQYPPREKDLDRSHRQKNHASQTQIETVTKQVY